MPLCASAGAVTSLWSSVRPPPGQALTPPPFPGHNQPPPLVPRLSLYPLRANVTPSSPLQPNYHLSPPASRRTQTFQSLVRGSLPPLPRVYTVRAHRSPFRTTSYLAPSSHQILVLHPPGRQSRCNLPVSPLRPNTLWSFRWEERERRRIHRNIAPMALPHLHAGEYQLGGADTAFLFQLQEGANALASIPGTESRWRALQHPHRSRAVANVRRVNTLFCPSVNVPSRPPPQPPSLPSPRVPTEPAPVTSKKRTRGVDRE